MGVERKRILVTGSNGLLGQKLSDLYLGVEGIEYMATSFGEDRYPGPGKYTYTTLDITDQENLRKTVDDFKPDTIINTAAMTNVDACETQRDACTAINVEAVKNMAALCKEMDIHLIHISTDFIFPGTKSMYSEEDIPEPLSFYGKSKWLGEQHVMNLAGNYSILRTAIVFGVANKLSRGNTIQWAYDTLKSGNKANVVNDQFRTPTLAEDLAMGCRLVESKNAYGVYNICGKDFMSILEMVERVALFFGFSMDNISVVTSESLNQPAKRPPVTGLSIAKARKDLGYEPHSFEEALDVFRNQLKKQN